MSDKPILFSGEMVRAILEGRKSQTRRIVKLKNLDPASCGAIYPDGSGKGWVAWSPGNNVTAELTRQEYPGEVGFKCPYGAIGDILWVREVHYRYGVWVRNGQTKTGREKWKFVPTTGHIYYADTIPAKYEIRKNSYRKEGWYKRLARFMPRIWTRIFLKITDIRVERLHDISEGDAIAEGVGRNCQGDIDKCAACRSSKTCHAVNEWVHYTRGFDDFPAFSAAESFESLWEKINGPESWRANPWVWVVTFEKIDKPENFK